MNSYGYVLLQKIEVSIQIIVIALALVLILTTCIVMLADQQRHEKRVLSKGCSLETFVSNKEISVSKGQKILVSDKASTIHPFE